MCGLEAETALFSLAANKRTQAIEVSILFFFCIPKNLSTSIQKNNLESSHIYQHLLSKTIAKLSLHPYNIRTTLFIAWWEGKITLSKTNFPHAFTVTHQNVLNKRNCADNLSPYISRGSRKGYSLTISIRICATQLFQTLSKTESTFAISAAHIHPKPTRVPTRKCRR